MNAKDYLRNLRRMDIHINQSQKELDMLTKNRTYLSSFDYAKDRVQTSADGQGFTRLSDKLVDLYNAINAEIDSFVDKRHEIIAQIQALEHIEYSDILFKRYVEYKTFEQISCEMNYAYNYVCNLHGAALKEFQELHLTS
jgi:hypothetical protein